MNTTSRAICVLGMHRSGTSALMRSLNLTGVYVGENLMKPAPENVEGFWEHVGIVECHDRLLHRLGREWDTPYPMEDNWWETGDFSDIKQELKDIVKLEFARFPLWGWKDPRTCILLPIWIRIINELNIPVDFVIALRNPLEVVDSLMYRNGFSARKSQVLWFLYMLQAIYDTHSHRRVVAQYDNLLRDWAGELGKVASFLELPWPVHDQEFNNSMNIFLSPRHRHSNRSMRDAKQELPKSIYELYELLYSTPFLDTNKTIRKVKELHTIFNRSIDFLVPVSDTEVHEFIQIYYSNENTFSESNSLRFPISKSGELNCEFHLEALNPLVLRIDPCNSPALIKIQGIDLIASNPVTGNVVSKSMLNNSTAHIVSTNHVLQISSEEDLVLVSIGDDPQIIFAPISISSYELKLSIRLNIDFSIHLEVIKCLQKRAEDDAEMISKLEEKDTNLKITQREIGLLKDKLSHDELKHLNVVQEMEHLSYELDGCQTTINGLTFEVNNLNQQIDSFRFSRSWRLTLPLRRIGQVVRLFRKQ